MRRSAPDVQAGSVRVRVEWRDLDFDRGVAIRVDVRSCGCWKPALKLDAFENDPHIHLFHTPSNQETVRRIDSSRPLEWCVDHIARKLPELLVYTGHPSAGRALSVEAIDALVRSVRDSIEAVVCD